ncbi:RDD family protein [Thermoflavimicrobium daqui]|jgi:uncharacterized RDD family membrane protein YckC|uniref:RDD domain-containing protein n=1 Tax=Thermoflavimicrobium daqui TaxID=2137476 RepID=A0A364K274_9BACL|nr:RDD family protein [Thermoflavimicrobium daqui]RAL22518.1 hypothetical protein DL897_13980 [Thermoflavimicrobium daqui]
MRNVVMVHTPEYVQIPLETAGIATRGIAKVIDYLCVFVLSTILSFVGLIFTSMGTDVSANDPLTSMEIAVLIVIGAAIPIGYFTMTEYWMKGQTIGKRVMRLRVIQDNGQRPTIFSVFLRNLLQLVDMLPFAFFLGMATAFINRKEKRIGDLVAGTMVVCEKKSPSELHLYFTYPDLSSYEREMYQRLPIISGDLYKILEDFLIRREKLNPVVRKELAIKLINKGWSSIQVYPNQEEFFLEKVYLYLRGVTYPSQYPYIYSQYFPNEK